MANVSELQRKPHAALRYVPHVWESVSTIKRVNVHVLDDLIDLEAIHWD